MALKKERVFAGFFAVLFILSTLMISVAIIMQMVQDSKAQKEQDTAQAKLAELNSKKTEGNMEDKLQGKPLANFTPVADIPELKTEDLVPGTGEEVKPGATVTVDYTGALASTGIVFESSKDSGQQATFPLSSVIKGWTEGIPGMKEGGTRRLLIPSDLAYGPSGSGTIPANSDLVFDVTLTKVEN